MKKTTGVSLTLLALFCALALPASPTMAQPKKQGVPAAVAVETMMMDAEITAVDVKSRRVTLKLPNGDLVDLLVGNQVKNLSQVKVGDIVVAEYQQALALKLKKSPGVRSTTEAPPAMESAPKGKKPAAGVSREVDFVADVVDVDAAKGLVTIMGAKGNKVTLKVKDTQTLAEIKTGDQIEGTYIQALAVAVLPKPAAK